MYHKGCFSVKRTLTPKCYRDISAENQNLESVYAYQDILKGSTLDEPNGVVKKIVGFLNKYKDTLKGTKFDLSNVEFCIDGPNKGNKPNTIHSDILKGSTSDDSNREDNIDGPYEKENKGNKGNKPNSMLSVILLVLVFVLYI